MSIQQALLNVTTAVPTYGGTMTIPEDVVGPFTFHASIAGTGAQTATVILYASNTGVSTDWLTLGTVTLSGTTTATDGFAFTARWKYLRAGVTAISGTGATVNAVLFF